jgi:drug/metabolite transporter (DMT)-like permease
VTATLLGMLVLGERLDAFSAAGVAILGFALLALALQRQPRPDRTPVGVRYQPTPSGD